MSDRDADPTRFVADADVLAADVFLDGDARHVLDEVRRHSWLTLVASDRLLADAEAVIATLGDATLAAEWRECIDEECVTVEQPPGDHPGLASAYAGGAAHLLTYDNDLTSVSANLGLQPRTAVSIRPPEAFGRLFDAASLYESVFDDDYPGPDRQLE